MPRIKKLMFEGLDKSKYTTQCAGSAFKLGDKVIGTIRDIRGQKGEVVGFGKNTGNIAAYFPSSDFVGVSRVIGVYVSNAYSPAFQKVDE